MRIFRAAAALVPLLLSGLLAHSPVKAADYRLDGQIDSGALSGGSFSALLSWQDGMISGVGLEAVAIDRFEMLLDGQIRRLDAADAPAQVHFLDGALLGLELTDLDSPGLASIAFVPGFTQLGEAWLAYELPGSPGSAGIGSYQISPVPEPASMALLGAGLLMLGARARRHPALAATPPLRKPTC